MKSPVRTLLSVLLIVSGAASLFACTTPSHEAIGTWTDGPGDTTSPVSTATPIPTHTATPLPTATPTPTHTATPLPTATPIPTHTTAPLPTISATPPPTASTPVYTYEIVHAYPHDRNAFTQGLVFVDGILYEGTGLRGRSSLRRVDLESGEVLQIMSLPGQYFGEGVTVYDKRIFQLTWQSHIGFVYDKDSFSLIQTFNYPTEGWGITHDGTHLIMSDGSSRLHFLDPDSLEEIGQVEVYDDNGPVTWLNELEYIEGEVYANVWQTERIARIDPKTGQVVGWIELGGLLSPEDYGQPVDVLNGIAYDAENDRLFVTGKLWPKLFELKLIARE